MAKSILSSTLALVALLGSSSAAQAADEAKPIKALLVLGGCCHDYKAQKDILAKGIAARADVEVTIAFDPVSGTNHLNPVYNDADWAKGYDVIIHDECSADVKDKAVVDKILEPHRKGLPAVNLHCAMHCYRVPGSDDWFKFTGLTTHSHGKQLPIELSFVAADHAILGGLTAFTTGNEELYKNEKVWETVTPLIRGKQGKDDYLVAWTNDYGGTKVFSTTLGHNDVLVSDTKYLDLVTRGLLWSVGKLDHFHAAKP
jgi:type 1 glutamine amidotransferase